MIIFMVCLYHPTLSRTIISIATPYLPPIAKRGEFETVIRRKSTIQYQRQFENAESEATFASSDDVSLTSSDTLDGHGCPNRESSFSST